jgi:hypothetical protein
LCPPAIAFLVKGKEYAIAVPVAEIIDDEVDVKSS